MNFLCHNFEMYVSCAVFATNKDVSMGFHGPKKMIPNENLEHLNFSFGATLLVNRAH